jgi:hypothetical protein
VIAKRIQEKLELIGMCKNFIIKHNDKTGTYIVEYKNRDICAVIKEGCDIDTIQYNIMGCYEHKSDWVRIDMKSLKSLQRFCEALIS